MINIKEYLMTRGNEERRVYHIVKNGRIDLLQQIFPNAETLVAKTENCREFGYDVMANLADDGNTGMLKKILSAYFSENTEENNALKRRFLLSHRINGTPKDFHHFIRFLSPREQEQAKFEQMECSDIDEIVFQQQKLKRGVFPPDLRSKKDRRRAEFYYLLRDEYQNSLPLKNPHEKMPTARHRSERRQRSRNQRIRRQPGRKKRRRISFLAGNLSPVSLNQNPRRPAARSAALLPYRRSAGNPLPPRPIRFGQRSFPANAFSRPVV